MKRQRGYSLPELSLMLLVMAGLVVILFVTGRSVSRSVGAWREAVAINDIINSAAKFKHYGVFPISGDITKSFVDSALYPSILTSDGTAIYNEWHGKVTLNTKGGMLMVTDNVPAFSCTAFVDKVLGISSVTSIEIDHVSIDITNDSADMAGVSTVCGDGSGLNSIVIGSD